MKKATLAPAALLFILACVKPGGSGESVPVTVETITVQQADVSKWAYSYARLEGASQADVYGSGGIVESILVAPGDTVEAGELLAVLSTDIEYNSNTAAASANVTSANAVASQANDNLDRVTSLFNAGGASEQELLNAQLSAESARAALFSAQASYSSTSSRSGNAMVTAPFSGVVGRIHVDEGNPALASQPLLTIVSPELLTADLLLPEEAVGKLEIGDLAIIAVSSLNGESFSGTVTAVSPFIDPTSGLIAAEVSIDDETGALVPGMAVKIAVQLDVHDSVVAIPELSLICSTSGFLVAVEENGVVRIKEAIVGYRENGVAEIVTGLEPGESLIVAGQQMVIDGSRIVLSSTAGGILI